MDKKSIIIAVILFVVCFPVGIGYLIYKLAKRKSGEGNSAQSSQSIEDEMEQEKRMYDSWINSVCAEHGTPDKIVMIGAHKDALLVYDSCRKFILNKKVYSYSDLLDFQTNEKRINLDGSETITTKTNLGSVVGRSIVGGIIAGPAGAVIGGATASRTSTIRKNDDEHVWYEVAVKLRDLNEPTKVIECYVEESAAELDGVFGYIKSKQ